MKKSLVWMLSLIWFALIGNTFAAPMVGNAADYQVTVSVSPFPPRIGDNVFSITVKDKYGKPLNHADVKLSFFMPSMGMSGPKVNAQESKGTYAAKATLAMHTDWQLLVSIKPKTGKKVTANFNFKV